MRLDGLSLPFKNFNLFRLWPVAWEMQIRHQERQAERNRIAQDLHDTVLQDFYSASLQLETVLDQLPATFPSKLPLFRILEILGGITEGVRRALRGLPSPPAEVDDLPQEVSRIGQQLSAERMGFRVMTSGFIRQLHPLVREDVYRIVREALVNAFRHAQAAHIEVEFEYGAKRFRLAVRDDGRGIDPEVVRGGLEGHLGLRGMRERAERLGAKLEVRSRAKAGTEIELLLPNHIAFEGKNK
jgi:signal transduction histidine kinase